LEHRVDAGYGLERASGPALAVEVAVRLGARWEVALRAQGASLTARTAGALDRDIGEIGVIARRQALPWLTLHAGAARRVHATMLARQGWTLMDVGGEVRVPLAAGAATALAGASLLPVVAVNGLNASTLAFRASTGMDYRLAGVSVALLYSLERTDFPAARREQLSALAARVAIRLHTGRRMAVRGRPDP